MHDRGLPVANARATPPTMITLTASSQRIVAASDPDTVARVPVET